VKPGSSRFGAPPAVALAIVLCGCVLCGCAQLGLDTDQPLFRKRFDFSGQSGGYSFSDVQDSRRDRPITAGDLVDASGNCPAPPQPQQQAPEPSNQAASPAAPPSAVPADGSSLLGEGVGLGMSECDVVYRAGAPSNVQLGQKPNGDRTAVLTFQDGPRAGIYHFEGGKLMEMDRTAAPPPPPPQTAKKKPVKPKKQAKSSNAT
jgi:hypothetical protein